MKLNIDTRMEFNFKIILFSILFFNTVVVKSQSIKSEPRIVLGIERTDQYIDDLKSMRVGLVSNHSSVLNGKHLLDTLLSVGIQVLKVFSPEHGFRGIADAGEKVKSQVDGLTGIPIVSLYGNNKKPSAEQLKGIDVLIFDIQDVGARFYTYISTLHYVMEAAAENEISVIVLDKPNPNGHYIDGPVLEKKYKSFVGMHPIPVVHGMTIGEYAQMINGEAWLKNGLSCDLRVVNCLNYTHARVYNLPIAPSPNLPNLSSIYNYPSICFFEGTEISVGRGTDKPFQQIGHPDFKYYAHAFTPKPSFGSKNPKLKGQLCYGKYLGKEQRPQQIEIKYLLEFYSQFPNKEEFFTNFFNLLAGNNELQEQIKNGKTEEEIRSSWVEDLKHFRVIRNKYLIYPD